ncbi:MAG: hypothetical protein KAH04_06305 [Psychrilyobacter sp.]|nr:hypothetical protein [Psychrilyobacter sp.]
MKKLLLLFIICGTFLYSEGESVEKNKVVQKGRIPIKSQSFNRKQIYETKHFKIYYDTNSIEETKNLISVADNIAETQIEFFKMDMPKKKIKVYVEDGRDDTNAYSTGNGIHLYINNTGIVTSEFKEWMPYLFSHELTHELLNYKMKDTGINRYMPLSDEVVIQSTIPRWWTEGMAVLMESMISEGGGRTFDPEFTAISKRDMNEDEFKGLGPNPGFNKAYEYGNNFLKFYLETYGIEKSSEAIDYYAHHKMTNIGKVYGKIAGITADELYEKWTTYIKGSIDEKNVVEGGIVLDEESGLLQTIKDGQDIYLYAIKKDEIKSKLVGVDIETPSLTKITLDNFGNIKTKEELDIDFLTYGQIAIKDGFAYFVEIKRSSIRGTIDQVAYKLDLEKKSKTFLKDIKRATGFVNVDGTIYYSYNEIGTQGISSLDNETILNSGNYTIKNMKSTTDGKILVTAHLKGKTGLSIYELDPKTKAVKFIVNGSDPSKVGNTVYYVNSYGTDTNNIYKTEIGSNVVTKLTNVKYGAQAPMEINNKLFYSNFSKHGYRLTRLSKEEQLGEVKTTLILDSEKVARQNRNFNLYGKFGKDYSDKNINKEVISTKELKDNDNKEILGLFIPTLTKPQIMWDTGELSFISRSSNDKDIFLVGMGVKNVYQGGGSKPVFSFDKDSKNEAQYQIFETLYLHYFSEPSLSKSFIAWRHTEKTGHNDIAKNSQDHISEDELLLQLPFRVDTIDTDFVFSTDLQGDLFGGDSKYKKIDTWFGLGDIDEGLVHSSAIKFGAIQKSSNEYDGNFSQDTYYIDSNLKLFMPFLSDLTFFDINARVYNAPNQFSSDSRTTAALTDSMMLDDVENNVAIRNTYTATNIYGNFKYFYQIQHGSNFGKIYYTGILFNLGYTAVGYTDKNYEDKGESVNVIGVGVDPSITLLGNVFNDAGEFELGIGHAFIKNYASGESTKNENKSYMTLSLKF